jgi:hypothetical protein
LTFKSAAEKIQATTEFRCNVCLRRSPKIKSISELLRVDETKFFAIHEIRACVSFCSYRGSQNGNKRAPEKRREAITNIVRIIGVFMLAVAEVDVKRRRKADIE